MQLNAAGERGELVLAVSVPRFVKGERWMSDGFVYVDVIQPACVVRGRVTRACVCHALGARLILYGTLPGALSSLSLFTFVCVGENCCVPDTLTASKS